MPMVSIAMIATDSVAPPTPSRSAANMSAGKIRYESGALVETATAVRTITAAIVAAPDHERTGRHAAAESRAHARASGTTTRAPEVSPSHHVRQNVIAS